MLGLRRLFRRSLHCGLEPQYGEVLRGEYQVSNNHSVAVGFSGGRTATAAAAGSGRPVVVNATGGTPSRAGHSP
jgi:hypothetical protein